MKKKVYLFLSIAFAAVLGLSSCSKDENAAPTIKSAAISADNKTITVTFSEAVYSKADATGALDATNLTVTAPAALKFTYTVTHTAGSTTATVNLVITSIVQGTEKFTVKPASATTVYDKDGKAMDVSAMAETNVAAKDLGIIGKWLSEGANVAPLLAGPYFNVLKIDAEFKSDFTYVVNQFNIGNTTTTPNVIFRGTYVIAKSTTGNIWTISCNQTAPSEAIASGIFEIKTGPEVLWYEVVQTSGTANIPPTPVAGFGSSTNGAYGMTLVQKYVRVP